MRRVALAPAGRLRRTSPLARFAPLRAKKALPRTAMPRAEREAAVPDDVRKYLAARSGGWCEIQLEGCWRRATDPHHRITRKDGGRHGAARRHHDRLSNLLHACRRCHRAVHGMGDPAFRKDRGWRVREGFDTALRPVRYRGELVYLGDEGQVAGYEAVGT